MGCSFYYKDHYTESPNYTGWHYEKYHNAHIHAVGFGGVFDPWNIAYLCPSCHKDFDNVYLGKIQEYFNQIDWIKKRKEVILFDFISFMQGTEISKQMFQKVETGEYDVMEILDKFVNLSGKEKYNINLLKNDTINMKSAWDLRKIQTVKILEDINNEKIKQ